MLCIDAVFIYWSAITIYCKCVSANKIIVIVSHVTFFLSTNTGSLHLEHYARSSANF